MVVTVGMEAADLYNSLPFTSDSEQKGLGITVDLLEAYFDKQRYIYEWYLFHYRQQQMEGETARDYVVALRSQAHLCDFENIAID